MSVDYYFKNRLSKNSKELQQIMDKPWLVDHIKNGHGPLCAAYPQEYTSEGDTPSFMPLIRNGLEQHTDYTLGGWGGRPEYKNGNHMQDGNDLKNGVPDSHYTFQRWLPAIQNDWAARADWCVADEYSKANHQPVARILGESVRTVRPGEKIILDASSSFDPDKNSLSYQWWQYREAGSVQTKVAIKHVDEKRTEIIVPDNPGKQLHLILELTDNGTPNLKSYKRVILNVN